MENAVDFDKDKSDFELAGSIEMGSHNNQRYVLREPSMISGGGADISDSYEFSIAKSAGSDIDGIEDDTSDKGRDRGNMNNNNKQLSNSYKPTKRHDRGGRRQMGVIKS